MLFFRFFFSARFFSLFRPHPTVYGAVKAPILPLFYDIIFILFYFISYSVVVFLLTLSIKLSSFKYM